MNWGPECRTVPKETRKTAARRKAREAIGLVPYAWLLHTGAAPGPDPEKGDYVVGQKHTAGVKSGAKRHRRWVFTAGADGPFK